MDGIDVIESERQISFISVCVCVWMYVCVQYVIAFFLASTEQI